VSSTLTSANGGVDKYLKAETAGSFDATKNAIAADDSSRKRKAKGVDLRI
jgi:hypothetical protein